jgi:S-adenosylmethionine:tRNA ribosyltransferase-isomerase
LFARKEKAEGAKIEVFLLKQIAPSKWECLVRPGKRVHPGVRLLFGEGMTGLVTDICDNGGRIVQFDTGYDFHTWMLHNGETPLPPYINAKLKQTERYQTVYSKNEGSVAAPTAGLHFTPELLQELTSQGIQTGFLTLHVGLGTFRPVQVEQVEEHQMHSEFFTLSEDLAQRVASTKKAGGRVIAVGTTSVRVLESQARPDGTLVPGSGETSIFIYPGYSFKVIDGLITNFHLPKSSLLMLVSAFAGYDFVMETYSHAIDQKYRFFSFGDAMLIL